ncbi:NUDIX domain-containing protein [Paucisalibacillus globulus]|uniref:NUDIX domain-containing protein n=1 Tax=Paucisalibacillus globulus TaxID=351095 RepID=UPI0004235113|nr:NUDIX domain-containing protein [Paucisalibacillus globulus]
MDRPFHHLARGIIIKNNTILVAHAIGHRNTFLPGGHIEFGESAKDALIREINEELGMDCKVGTFVGVIEHKWMKQGVVNYEVNQVFEVQCDDLLNIEIPISKESHIEFLWQHVEELEEHNLQPYPLTKIIHRYLNGMEKLYWASTLNEDIDEYNKE